MLSVRQWRFLKVIIILGNRNGGKVTKVHTDTSVFPLPALTMPKSASMQQKFWLRLCLDATYKLTYCSYCHVASDNNWPLTVLFVLDSKLMARIIAGVRGCWRPCHIDKVFTRVVSRDHWHTWRYNISSLQTFINGSKHVIILSKVTTYI